MKILLYTEKEDYVKVLGLIANDIHNDIEVDSITDCQLANVALSHPHDLIVIDDRLYDHLNASCLEVLEKTQMDAIVLLQKKSHIHRYLNLRLVDYFVSPFEWQLIDNCLRKEFRRNQVLGNLEHEGEVPHKYVLKKRTEVNLIDFKDILFFHKVDKMVQVHTEDMCYTTHDSLKHIQTQLPDSFVRVHASYIVNFDHATAIVDEGNRSYHIEFTHYNQIAMMSRKRAEELKHDTLNHYRLSFIEGARKD